MGSNYSLKYNVDIVMCIDATGSMGGLLDKVKKNALNFYSDLTGVMEKKGKHIDELRVRIVVFRDYAEDGENAMLATDFYSLPQDAAVFESLVKSIQPFGGGDDPEDGLEALAYAMESAWTTGGDKQRHVIVVWSDDGTHPLGFGKKAANYPTKMAKDFEELSEWWGDKYTPGKMNQAAKRLLIYAPDKEYWRDISDSWDKTVHFPSVAGGGLNEYEYDEILNEIANSISI